MPKTGMQPARAGLDKNRDQKIAESNRQAEQAEQAARAAADPAPAATEKGGEK